MVSVEKARELIKTTVFPLKTVEVKVADSHGLYLDEDIIAPVSIPLFNQSAMDGYAFKFEDVNNPLTIVDKIPAGDTRVIDINKGEAIRIFTGSKVPASCDTVVMQELIEIKEGKLIVKDSGLKLGGNVRLKGNQIEKGSVALKKGAIINAGAVGFLATLGITEINVYQKPKAVIIATGSELVKPGEKLAEGQIYESNTVMLEAALKQKGIAPTIFVVQDNKNETSKVIAEALKNNDLVLLSGGISVGDYDFVKEALENNGVTEVFYKIKQKPGKPLYFGKTEKSYVFALPGNPAAALNCFYEYVSMSINIMIGNPQIDLPIINIPISKTYTKKIGRSNFLKATTDFKTVTPLEGQGSDALQAFSLANCIIYLPENDTVINKNELVEVHLLP
ncbi:MAG: gephyrin-like molybdotransferase Glp [Vicingaceae bacterium]